MTAVYVTQGQQVNKGDALIEIQEAGGSRITTVSPIDGSVALYPSLRVGASVQTGQHLLTIRSTAGR